MAAARSLLFVPGNRPDLLEKARNYPADGFILDLEDAVPAVEKPAARVGLKNAVRRFAGREVWVRTNAPDSEAGMADLQTLTGASGLHGFVLPKIETVETVRRVGSLLDECESGMAKPRQPTALMLIIESALAAWRSFDLATASPRVETIMFASARDGDLMSDLGCDWTGEGAAMLYARAHVLLTARAARIAFPLDGVFTDIRDSEGFERDSRRSRSLGYRGRAVIHPSQIVPTNQIYQPTAVEVDRSRRLLAAFDAALRRGHASAVFEGTMIDIAMANAARRVLRLAGDIDVQENTP